jgi:hypothetical protein
MVEGGEATEGCSFKWGSPLVRLKKNHEYSFRALSLFLPTTYVLAKDSAIEVLLSK